MKTSIVNHPARTHIRQPQAFTIVELMVVLAILAVLASILLPGLAHTRTDTQTFRCQNNLRQLTVGWGQYANDNSGQLMRNSTWVGGLMSWGASSENIDTAPLLTNDIGSYIKSAKLFKCPADTYQSQLNPGPRVRSVSVNGALGGGGPDCRGSTDGLNRVYYAKATAGPGVGRGTLTMDELIHPGPAQVFVILDEHPDSLMDPVFMLDPGEDIGAQKWRDLPGSFHNNSGSLSFADGHTEIPKWQNPKSVPTIYPVSMTAPGSQPWSLISGKSSDYRWMTDRMPYR